MKKSMIPSDYAFQLHPNLFLIQSPHHFFLSRRGIEGIKIVSLKKGQPERTEACARVCTIGRIGKIDF